METEVLFPMLQSIIKKKNLTNSKNDKYLF